jgi:membrane-associated phospholipid phosphatase
LDFLITASLKGSLPQYGDLHPYQSWPCGSDWDGFFVDRPFVHNRVNLLYPHVKDSSFPSDHATSTMCIGLGLWKGERRVSLILMLVSFAVGFCAYMSVSTCLRTSSAQMLLYLS